MSKTIYMVTDGCYSEFRVIGIYSTKEKADHSKKLRAAENEVEIWKLDEIMEHPPGKFWYSVVMDKEGNTQRSLITDADDAEDDADWSPWEMFKDSGFMDFRMWAADKKHAIKIANERRLALLHSGEWTTNYDEWLNKKYPK